MKWIGRGWGVGGGIILLGAGLTLAQQPSSPVVTPPAVPAPEGTSALDGPLQLLASARRSFQEVQDYTCVLIKRERLHGQLQPNQVIAMQVRTQPFSIHLHWQDPRPLTGQEVCYVAGRNGGQMRVHPAGLAGVVGWMSLDPHDPRALEHTRHSVTEAGIGNLLERYQRGWEEERRLNRTQVHQADYEFDHRPCTRVETVHTPGSGNFPFSRCVVYFDKETHLPVRIENYDWPRPGGNREGELLEVYSYAHLRLNVGLGDEVFAY